MYSIVGATFGIFLDQNCSNQIGTLTTNENGDTNEVEVTAGTVYIKELSAPIQTGIDGIATEHKEINDEGQTVTIKEVPEIPTPETPGTTTKTSNPPKTGDTANAILWIAILVLSAAGITGVRIWNKKKQVKRLGIEEKKEEEE